MQLGNGDCETVGEGNDEFNLLGEGLSENAAGPETKSASVITDFNPEEDVLLYYHAESTPVTSVTTGASASDPNNLEVYVNGTLYAVLESVSSQEFDGDDLQQVAI